MNVKSLTIKLIGTFLGMVLAASASANLIVNGGFEDTDVKKGTWNYFKSENVSGWEGSNIEIWDAWHKVVSPEGQQHAELNAHPYTGGVFTIFQNFATVVGQTYDVSFFYSAVVSSNEAFKFSVGNIDTLVNDHVVGTWNHYSNSFVASSTSTAIKFVSIENGTYGNFLDGISVVARANVPESSSLVLLAIGLLGLGLMRKQLRS